MHAVIARDFHRAQKRNIEGPTRTQVARARRRIAALRAEAAEARAAGNEDRAFDLECEVFDIAGEFRPYGYELDR